MPLSDHVTKELTSLRVYYKSLYYARWFLPRALKKPLNDLELQNDNPSEATVFFLCHAFLELGWFSKLILMFFSGLSSFSSGSLIKHVSLLEKEQLFCVPTCSILVTSSSFKDAYEGLLLWKQVGKQGPPTKIAIQALIHTFSMKLTPASSVYNDIISHSNPVDFAKALAWLQEKALAWEPIYNTLRLTSHPFDLAHIFKLFVLKGLLFDAGASTTVPDNQIFIDRDITRALLKKRIWEAIIACADPVSLIYAVILLEDNKILDDPSFDELQKSDSPAELAQIFITFYNHNRLDLQILPKLEQHRKTLVTLDNSKIMLRPDQRLDHLYCASYALWVNSSYQNQHADMHAFFNEMYHRFGSTDSWLKCVSELCPLLERCLLGCDVIGATCRAFLTEAPLDHVTDYIKLITLLSDAQLLPNDPEQLKDIFSIIKQCPDIPALLNILVQRKKATGMTKQELRGFVAQQLRLLNPNLFHSPDFKQVIDKKVSQEASVGLISSLPSSHNPSWNIWGWFSDKSGGTNNTMPSPDYDTLYKV